MESGDDLSRLKPAVESLVLSSSPDAFSEDYIDSPWSSEARSSPVFMSGGDSGGDSQSTDELSSLGTVEADEDVVEVESRAKTKPDLRLTIVPPSTVSERGTFNSIFSFFAGNLS